MIIHNVALVGLIVVSVLLIIVVLLMSGRTTGLGALTGGAE
ncbi:MAG: preprotein translocase subunit SecG, partial [Exiguobacterium sp.]